MSRTNRVYYTFKKVPEYKSTWMTRGPGWFFSMTSNRPRRREEKYLLHMLKVQNIDSEAINWPLGNHKPHYYWW